MAGENDKFEVYKDKRGEYRWRRKAVNGAIIGASSEGYTKKKDAEANAARQGYESQRDASADQNRSCPHSLPPVSRPPRASVPRRFCNLCQARSCSMRWYSSRVSSPRAYRFCRIPRAVGCRDP